MSHTQTGINSQMLKVMLILSYAYLSLLYLVEFWGDAQTSDVTLHSQRS